MSRWSSVSTKPRRPEEEALQYTLIAPRRSPRPTASRSSACVRRQTGEFNSRLARSEPEGRNKSPSVLPANRCQSVTRLSPACPSPRGQRSTLRVPILLDQACAPKCR